MAATAPPARSLLHALLHALRRAAHVSWQMLNLGALVLALAITPSSYRQPWRHPLTQQVLRAVLPLLPWFTLLAAVLSLVIVRIVLVTALSYGLSQFALEMVIRVLVIELIPLTAALAVALRVTITSGSGLPSGPLTVNSAACVTAQARPSSKALKDSVIFVMVWSPRMHGL